MALLDSHTQRQWNLRAGRAHGADLDRQTAHPCAVSWPLLIARSEAGWASLPRVPFPHPSYVVLLKPSEHTVRPVLQRRCAGSTLSLAQVGRL